jgi:hypothetical protein
VIEESKGVATPKAIVRGVCAWAGGRPVARRTARIVDSRIMAAFLAREE